MKNEKMIILTISQEIIDVLNKNIDFFKENNTSSGDSAFIILSALTSSMISTINTVTEWLEPGESREDFWDYAQKIINKSISSYRKIKGG